MAKKNTGEPSRKVKRMRRKAGKKIARINERTEKLKQQTAKEKEKTVEAKQRTMKAKGLQEPTGPAPKLETNSSKASKPNQPVRKISDTKGVKSGDMTTAQAVKYKESDKRQGKDTKLISEIVKNSAQREYGPGSKNFERVTEDSFTKPEDFAKLENEVSSTTNSNPVGTTQTTVDGVSTSSGVSSQVAKEGEKLSEVVNSSEIGESVEKAQEEIDKSINEKSDEIGKATGEQPNHPVADLASKGEGGYTAQMEGGLTPADLQAMGMDHQKHLAAQKALAPKLALEQLGVDHYFPPQQDFLTSTFTGRYIGSRQIVSAVPGRVPVSLYDARNRALEEKAKNKKKMADIADKFLNYKTAEQYQEELNDIVYESFFDFYNAAGRDADSLIGGQTELSQEFLKTFNGKIQPRARSIMEVDAYVKKVIADIEKGDVFIPQDVIDAAYDFHNGTENMKDFILGGEKTDQVLQRVRNSMRSYEGFTKAALEEIKVLKELGPDSFPMAAGAKFDLSNPEMAANAIAAIEEAKYSRDYESFIQTVGKFFDVGKMESVLDGIMMDKNIYLGKDDDEVKKIKLERLKYMYGHMPSVIETQISHKDNKKLNWWEEANRHAEAEENLSIKKKLYQTQWDTMHQDTNAANQDLNSLWTSDAYKKATPQERSDMEAKVYDKHGLSPDTKGGFAVNTFATSGKEFVNTDVKRSSIVSLTGRGKVAPEKELNIINNLYKDGKVDPAMLNLFNKKFGKNLSVREIEMAKQDLETLKNNTRIPLNVASRGTGKAVYRDNKYIPTSKAGDFSDSDVRTIGQVSGQFRVTTGETDPNSGKAVVRPSMYELITTYNIDSQSERDALLLNEADQGEDVRYNIVDEDRSSSTRVSVRN